MNRLLELLEENTDIDGSFNIQYNEHNQFNMEITEYYIPCCAEEYEDWNNRIDWKQPILKLNWYKEYNVEHHFISNSVQELTDFVQGAVRS